MKHLNLILHILLVYIPYGILALISLSFMVGLYFAYLEGISKETAMHAKWAMPLLFFSGVFLMVLENRRRKR